MTHPLIRFPLARRERHNLRFAAGKLEFHLRIRSRVN
jgi:hypothetical protein